MTTEKAPVTPFVVDRKQYERLVKVEVAVRDYVASKQRYDRKWHQDNCPERGDYHRWYADRNRAYEVLQQKFAILRAALSTEGVTR